MVEEADLVQALLRLQNKRVEVYVRQAERFKTYVLLKKGLEEVKHNNIDYVVFRGCVEIHKGRMRFLRGTPAGLGFQIANTALT